MKLKKFLKKYDNEKIDSIIINIKEDKEIKFKEFLKQFDSNSIDGVYLKIIGEGLLYTNTYNNTKKASSLYEYFKDIYYCDRPLIDLYLIPNKSYIKIDLESNECTLHVYLK